MSWHFAKSCFFAFIKYAHLKNKCHVSFLCERKMSKMIEIKSSIHSTIGPNLRESLHDEICAMWHAMNAFQMKSKCFLNLLNMIQLCTPSKYWHHINSKNIKNFHVFFKAPITNWNKWFSPPLLVTYWVQVINDTNL